MKTIYRKEKQYISLGLILSKMYGVLEFEQPLSLKAYIHLNSKLRAESTNKFGVETFK